MAATWLADALRAGGLPVVEHAGWKTRGRPGTFTPKGVLVHHTAGARTGDLPSLSYVISGSSALPGPLSQLMLSRSGVFHVVASGRCNHAGAGWASWVGNNGNSNLIGIEAESVGSRDDWTPAQRAAYPKGVAALLRYMGLDESRCLAHKEWALPRGRKTDPAFWEMNQFRASVRAHLRGTAPPPPEDDDLSAAAEKMINEIHSKVVRERYDASDHNAPAKEDLLGHVMTVRKVLSRLSAEVDQILARLPEAPAADDAA
jgi:hypothetical protein